MLTSHYLHYAGELPDTISKWHLHPVLLEKDEMMVTAPVEVGKDGEEMRESEMPATITDHQFQNPSFSTFRRYNYPTA